MTLRAGRPSLLSAFSVRGLQLLRHLPTFVRLYWRLLCDRRVSIWPKALLVVGALYVISPLDLIPDFIIGLGEIDDLVVFIVLCKLFIHLCPPEIVREHVQRLGDENRAVT